MLQTLEITNFRGIRSLKLEKLEPVNLIVGKNNEVDPKCWTVNWVE